jgi:hypothetical protein
MIPNLDAEMRLVGAIKSHIGGVFDGDTTHEKRKAAIRKLIRDNGIEVVVASTRRGKPITYEEAFGLVYGEEL